MAILLLASEMPVPISRAPRRPIPARRPPLQVPAGPLLAPDAPAGGAPDGKRNRKCRLPPLGPHDVHSDSWKGSNEFWILALWAGPPGVPTPTASHNVDACVHSVLVVAQAGGWTGGLRWCYIHKRRKLVRSGSIAEGWAPRQERAGCASWARRATATTFASPMAARCCQKNCDLRQVNASTPGSSSPRLNEIDNLEGWQSTSWCDGRRRRVI